MQLCLSVRRLGVRRTAEEVLHWYWGVVYCDWSVPGTRGMRDKGRERERERERDVVLSLLFYFALLLEDVDRGGEGRASKREGERERENGPRRETRQEKNLSRPLSRSPGPCPNSLSSSQFYLGFLTLCISSNRKRRRLGGCPLLIVHCAGIPYLLLSLSFFAFPFTSSL